MEIADGLAFVESFANVTALVSDDRLVLIDAGGVLHAQQVHTAVRELDRRTARHRRLHPRTRRPRVRRSLLRGRGRAAATRRSSHTSGGRPLRPVQPDQRLQRRDQPAAVLAGRAAVPLELPLPRHHLSRPPRRLRRRPRHRTAPRPGRDRRPHVGVDSRVADALHRRPVHLGVAQLREPAEGPALPGRVGPGAAQDDREASPSSSCPATGCPSSGRTGSPWSSTRRPSCWSRSSPSRST